MSATKTKPARPAKAPAKSVKGAARQNGVEFVCDLKPNAKEVFLVGEFNDWDTNSDKLVKRKGVFKKKMILAPGEYQYKFLVDGEWHCDPLAPKQVPNEFGTLNSVVHVEELSDR